DLVQRLQVLADALVQLHRRQRGVGTDARVQVAQYLAERQAVGVEQVRCRFDVVQHRAERGEPLRTGGAQQRIELRGDRVALLQSLVEQLLADAGGGGTV